MSDIKPTHIWGSAAGAPEPAAAVVATGLQCGVADPNTLNWVLNQIHDCAYQNNLDGIDRFNPEAQLAYTQDAIVIYNHQAFVRTALAGDPGVPVPGGNSFWRAIRLDFPGTVVATTNFVIPSVYNTLVPGGPLGFTHTAIFQQAYQRKVPGTELIVNFDIGSSRIANHAAPKDQFKVLVQGRWQNGANTAGIDGQQANWSGTIEPTYEYETPHQVGMHIGEAISYDVLQLTFTGLCNSQADVSHDAGVLRVQESFPTV